MTPGCGFKSSLLSASCFNLNPSPVSAHIKPLLILSDRLTQKKEKKKNENRAAAVAQLPTGLIEYTLEPARNIKPKLNLQSTGSSLIGPSCARWLYCAYVAL